MYEVSKFRLNYFFNRQPLKQTADAPNVWNFPRTDTLEPFRIFAFFKVSDFSEKSAKTTKPGTSPGSTTNLHCPSRLTRFRTVPKMSTAAPTICDKSHAPTARPNLSQRRQSPLVRTSQPFPFPFFPFFLVLNLSSFNRRRRCRRSFQSL